MRFHDSERWPESGKSRGVGDCGGFEAFLVPTLDPGGSLAKLDKGTPCP